MIMFNFAPVRMFIILLYFLTCTACGHPADEPGQADEPVDNSTYASDVNFIGGGTQTPDVQPVEEPYHSPTLSTPPPPSNLTWLSSIEQAVRMSERNNRYRVILWLRNEGCDECAQIERDVFTDTDVISKSRYWYFVKVDTDRNPEAALDLLHGADPPALVFLDNRGYEYDRFYGTFSAAELATMLERGKA